MSPNFGSLVFTPAVKALQERYGSRRQYARIEGSGSSPARLGPEESEFIGERDTFYMATVIRIEAFDWNCQQHIVQRYTEEEIQEAVAPAENRMHEIRARERRDSGRSFRD
jgi:hypothetical protein